MPRLVRHPGLRVQIQFLLPLNGSALPRRQISNYCRRAIGESLGLETSDTLSLPDYPGLAEPPAPPSTSLVEAA